MLALADPVLAKHMRQANFLGSPTDWYKQHECDSVDPTWLQRTAPLFLFVHYTGDSKSNQTE
ncbi:hypothetical protein J1N35_011020 [Gossypium stocksii]|uniref:Uncharacterized protein n=1 Tax=Gossypium stocksii TaxID=47602 RepID=A0A9D3W2P8_9ROSI|nr:hypothetical protein J1N35_011020 [Gossypium stocksii]